jgi:hypothetical protein
MKQTNIAETLATESCTAALCGLVAHAENTPVLIYKGPEKKAYVPNPLEEALLRDDYKHTPSGVY